MIGKFDWLPFYEEFSEVLYNYRDNQDELHEIIVDYFKEESLLSYLNFNHDEWWPEGKVIDPFSIFGIFNRGINDENRRKIIRHFIEVFNMSSHVPSDFDGIPRLNNMRAFYENKDNVMWELYIQAINYDKDSNNSDEFQQAFDNAIAVKGNGLTSITMGLYWVQPHNFLALDQLNCKYLMHEFGMDIKSNNMGYEEYINVIETVKSIKGDTSFFELSLDAYLNKESKDSSNQDRESDDKTSMDIIKEPQQTEDYVDRYNKEQFLDEVFLSEEDYETLTSLLYRKQNIILQGAPGVGKTFTAKRLAWSLIGSKDSSKIEMIQFHQSYSYEDFIMGYKPQGDGFVLKKGIFTTVCDKAINDPDHHYFLIIDEINRGNMSKIFGELLMLIEKDYREVEIKLPYNAEKFSVPKNLYIIGIMNTADRSLAMIDYALRRRFSFFEMKPGFDSEQFNNISINLNNSKFSKIIDLVKQLNEEIKLDSSLGSGFCIGHSYFLGKDNHKDETLKQIVQYDIIPILKEYWFDDEEKIVLWESRFRSILNDDL
ncbi:AAA family ATPase [Abyssicoccus albus]|uniref:5-methylcytosine-specific restriction protein B n=1 Tax=Abyssicoccus albus TaxID=1817405 RepID=A0A3N5CGG9_9BACL|nr:AAA family ATPase [Abyssicoccus albus]RPF56541.1 5-methylcytosine-specific restriction protein B [Abyssicoccus albus]